MISGEITARVFATTGQDSVYVGDSTILNINGAEDTYIVCDNFGDSFPIGNFGVHLQRWSVDMVYPCHNQLDVMGTQAGDIIYITYIQGIHTSEEIVASSSPKIAGGGFTYEGATTSLFLLLILVLFFFKFMSDRTIGVKRQHTENW